jgi:hypothetical protein
MSRGKAASSSVVAPATPAGIAHDGVASLAVTAG